MQYSSEIGSEVMRNVQTLPFWEQFEDRVSVAIVGSLGAGLADSLSDIDVYILVPEQDSMSMYGLHKEGYENGTLKVVNPAAFDFDEFPMLELENMNGHIRAMVQESIEEYVNTFDDVHRWIISKCIILHDPRGTLESLRKAAAEYPPEVLNRKLIRHYWFLRDFLFSTKLPLQRNQKEAVSILCVQGISHVLKFCILAEGKPFPYDKWLYRVACDTALGGRLKKYMDALFTEIHRQDIITEDPDEYVKPGHRNEKYEIYRIYHIICEMRRVFDENMPELTKDKYALWDRIGSWKPR